MAALLLVRQRGPTAGRAAWAPLARRSLTTGPGTVNIADVPQPQRAEPPPTAERYHGLRRDPHFQRLKDDDVAYFRSVLTDAGVETAPDVLDAYNVDWLRKYRGQATVALKPKTTAEVAKVLKYCNERRLPVVPQGGNTGLVGGGVPVYDEVILLSQRMNQVESLDPVSGILTCQAGCVLEALDNYLRARGHMMPLDLGAKGSCHIGGNVATNAGGLRLLRYGSLRGTVLGLEAVLPNGTVIDNLTGLRKDNTGFDLKQLFIGSEGSIGFITRVAILTAPKPKAVNLALMACKDYNAVMDAYKFARHDLGEVLSACEMMDNASIVLVEGYTPSRLPVDNTLPYYVLIETQSAVDQSERLDAYITHCLDKGIAVDGTIAQSEAQAAQIWKIREIIPEACVRAGVVYKYDLSLPVAQFYEPTNAIRARLKDKFPDVVSCGFGHLGDGNLHLNVVAKEFSYDLYNAIEPYIYEFTSSHRGSISAEHGLGLMKASALHHSKDEASVEMMRQIKQLLDPNGIMNPYKFLPSEYALPEKH